MEELKWHHRHQPRRVNGIVEEQVRRWQFHPTDAKSLFWPVVTISREAGSLGLDLGRRVAERLGFTFWDHEIVTAVAERLHVDPGKVLALDEHAPDTLDVVLTALRMAQTGLAYDYRAQLRILFASISHHGAAVIVGRGAHCAIPSTLALKVRLIAPLNNRIADYERTCHTTHEVAMREVQAGDKERAEFVRKTFHANITEPTDYDVIINVGTFEAP